MEPMKKKVMMSFFTYSSGKKPWIKRGRVEKSQIFLPERTYTPVFCIQESIAPLPEA